MVVVMSAVALASAHAQDPGAGADSPPAAPATPAAAKEFEVDTVNVRGRRPTEVGPMPGLGLTEDEIPANIQSITAKELRESGALSLTDLMNSQMQSVTVNDYQGNPFQMDLQYRGFTAGPQIGTPQGLSVFLDGIRVNEAFGDTVNWDLIPMNAISRLDVFPGSNPVFGLNTLGGALSLRTKTGFSDPGIEARALGGAWGRKQLQLSAGGNNGTIGGFIAIHGFEEDGWRDNSPSNVRQTFGRFDLMAGIASFGLSVLKVDNDLVGNGTVPIEDFRARPETIFTSPDETKNELLQYQLSAAFDFTNEFNVTAMTYRRRSERGGTGGDAYEDFDDMDLGRDKVTKNFNVLCKYADLDNDFEPDDWNAPLNAPCGEASGRTPNYEKPRNGASVGPGSTESGVVDGTPIGLRNRTELNQISRGGAVQFNWNLDRHKFMLGASIDTTRTSYLNAQQLGLLDGSRNFYLASEGWGPGQIDPIYYAAQNEIVMNDFDGGSRNRSLYFSETWSPRDNLHLSMSGRFNLYDVSNALNGRASSAGLHEFRNAIAGSNVFYSDPVNGTFVLREAIEVCSSGMDDETCERKRFNYDSSQLYRVATKEKHKYRSFNPSFGMNWLPDENTNIFANWSRGARAPSSIELGCAVDRTPVGNTFQSALTSYPVCYLPNTLSADPYLPQVRSKSGEIGARGVLPNGFSWNASVYRTDLSDDIYLVGVTPSRSYFDTIGDTRRQGLEMGLSGKVGKLDFRVNYAYTDATFQSDFYLLSPHNSSANFDRSAQGTASIKSPEAALNHGQGIYQMIRVQPGDKMPGVSPHNMNVTLGYAVTDALSFRLTAIAHSSAFLRGNENNQHEAGGTDKEVRLSNSAAQCGARPRPCYVDASTGRPFRYGGKSPGYAVLNLLINYKFDKHLTGFVQINNLLDKTYYSAGRLGITPFAPGAVGAIGDSGWNYNSGEWLNSTFVAPGAPRAIWFGLSLALDI
jgi:outer membrane receptor protein involved in Fe transport